MFLFWCKISCYAPMLKLPCLYNIFLPWLTAGRKRRPAMHYCHTPLHFLCFVCAPHTDMLVCYLNIYVGCLNMLENNKHVSEYQWLHSSCSTSWKVKLLLPLHCCGFEVNPRSSSGSRGLREYIYLTCFWDYVLMGTFSVQLIFPTSVTLYFLKVNWKSKLIKNQLNKNKRTTKQKNQKRLILN